MTEPTYLTHCRLVLPDRVVDDASLLIDGDGCLSVGTDCPSVARELDLGGVLVLPGLIDLHCDAIEKEVEPRAGVFFPYDFAIQQADRRNAAAGITTPYHAVSFADADLSDMARSFYADNRRVRNNRLKSALGLTLRYPTYREGLKAILASEN